MNRIGADAFAAPRHAFGAAVVGKKIYLPEGSIAQSGRGVPGTTAITDTVEPN
jgi:hypothetical protein